MLTRWLVKWLAVVGVLGLVVALFLPAVRTAKEPARRMQCSNNLKQIAFALREYESVYHSLPPAYTVDAEGKPLHSWRTLILPYLEQQALYDKIDLSEPWDDPANKAAYETTPLAYQCPSADCPPGDTTYLAVVAPGGCFRPTKPRDLSEVTDDPNLTLMVLEVDTERKRMNVRHIQRRWLASLPLTADLHPRTAHAAVAIASEPSPVAAMTPSLRNAPSTDRSVQAAAERRRLVSIRAAGAKSEQFRENDH
jgi:hypothetical protein